MSELPLRTQIGWGAKPKTFETPLVERCENALDLPLAKQTWETLRLLIGQGIGLEVLVPAALNGLERNILIGGDMYPGALVSSCQRVPAEYWVEHPDEWDRLQRILTDFDDNVEAVNKDRGVFLANNPYGAAL